MPAHLERNSAAEVTSHRRDPFVEVERVRAELIVAIEQGDGG
jgi:hypothetical protein